MRMVRQRSIKEKATQFTKHPTKNRPMNCPLLPVLLLLLLLTLLNVVRPLHNRPSSSSVLSPQRLSLLLLLVLFTVLALLLARLADSVMEAPHTFLYFAYGSNLLKERLQLKNPSAAVHCVARLLDYKLVFGNHKGLASDRWHGGVATIEHSPGDEVWGVVWRMNMSDLESLDSQENVRLGAYSPVAVSVKTRGPELSCRTYIMNSCVYALPSPQYMKVIVMGAAQNGLPEDYQDKLRAIQTNEYDGSLPVMTELDRAMKKAKEKSHRRSDA